MTILSPSTKYPRYLPRYPTHQGRSNRIIAPSSRCENLTDGRIDTDNNVGRFIPVLQHLADVGNSDPSSDVRSGMFVCTPVVPKHGRFCAQLRRVLQRNSEIQQIGGVHSFLDAP